MPAANIKHPDKLFIGGGWVAPKIPAAFDVLTTSTEEQFARVAAAGADDVARAVIAARKAFDEGPWPTMDPRERAGLLRALAAEIDGRADGSVVALTSETGMVFAMAQMMARMPGSIYAKAAGYAD